jgi:hypothetical protein
LDAKTDITELPADFDSEWLAAHIGTLSPLELANDV